MGIQLLGNSSKKSSQMRDFPGFRSWKSCFN